MQLLLIVDYVVDWARDVYRDGIITSLRSLASGDNDAASTIYPDTDILSTMEAEARNDSSLVDEDQAPMQYSLRQQAFMARDSNLHAVRDSLFVESRFRSVIVTRDNVRTMLHLTQRHMMHHLCRAVLKEMIDCMLLEYGAIRSMEEYWTKTNCNTAPLLKYDDKFFAVVECCYFISPTWHLVRELHVFGIAEGAWEDFAAFSGLRPTPVPQLDLGGATDSAKLMGELANATEDEDTLALCLGRFCGMISGKKLDCSDGMLHAIINYTHLALQKESANAQATFLRSSRKLEEKIDWDDPAVIRYRYRWMPGACFEPLELSEGGAILVHAKASMRDRDRLSANICLYILGRSDAPPTELKITRLIKEIYTTRDIYHSTRDNGPQSISVRTLPKWNLGVHNTRPIYGLCAQLETFVNILQMLDPQNLPDRQGSPRIEDGAMSGLYLHTRCFDPWRDRGGAYTTKDRTLSEHVQIFAVYKIISTEIKYWRKTAAERRGEGLYSCSTCARLDTVDLDAAWLCGKCLKAQGDPKLPRWFKRSLLGQPPFRTSERNKPSRMRLSSGLPSPKSETWDDVLGDYPELERGFRDISELHFQCTEFHDWWKRMEKGKKVRYAADQ